MGCESFIKLLHLTDQNQLILEERKDILGNLSCTKTSSFIKAQNRNIQQLQSVETPFTVQLRK